MRDKRYLVLGEYESLSYTYSLPILDSFDTEDEALKLFNKYVDRNYSWITLYDRIEGVIIKEY